MPLSAADRFEIMQLMARYNFAADFGDAEAWADTFSEDALFEGSLASGRGREELVGVIRGMPQDANWRHWNNNILIEGDGDEATATVYLMRLDVAGPPSVISSGIYRDTLKRVGGQWKFTHRKVDTDPQDG